MTDEDLRQELIRQGFTPCIADDNYTNHMSYSIILKLNGYAIRRTFLLDDFQFLTTDLDTFIQSIKNDMNAELILKAPADVKLVIAGNFTEYRWWMIKHKFKQTEYRYIPDFDRAHGYRRNVCYLVGTYWVNPAYNDCRLPSRDFTYKREDEI
jgi:hypothetical protein